jgi:hypothetical protein
MDSMDKPLIKLIKHGDGAVWRTSRCECGTVIYKKNLTTNEIHILGKRISALYQETVFEPLSNPSGDKLTCPNCGKKHIVGDIKEVLWISDDLTSVVE